MCCSIPDYVLQVAVQMKSSLTTDEIAYATTVANRAPWNRMSGQNRMQGLGIRLTLGVVRDNSTMVAEAFTKIWEFLIVQPGTCRCHCHCPSRLAVRTLC